MNNQRFEFQIFADAILGARANQEDDLRIARIPSKDTTGDEQPLLVVVTDGMGGHVSGEVASATACSTFIKSFSDNLKQFEQRLEAALVDSNEALRREIASNNALNGMGCTLVAGYIDKTGLRFVSVGDSLLLHLCGQKLNRLYQDHSMGALLDRQAEANIISKSDANSSPQRRVLRSALTGGAIPLRDLHATPIALEAGDWLLLASDGIETLSLDEIKETLNTYSNDGPREMVGRLLDEVRRRARPGQDNTSIVAVKVVDSNDKTHIIDGRPSSKTAAEITPPTIPMNSRLNQKRAMSRAMMFASAAGMAGVAMCAALALFYFVDFRRLLGPSPSAEQGSAGEKKPADTGAEPNNSSPQTRSSAEKTKEPPKTNQ